MAQTLSTYELVVQELGAAGVTMVSGLVSEDTSIRTSLLAEAGIVYRPTKHENISVNIADGYAWASGGLGVVFIGRGPGLTNGATALATLVHGRRPVLVVSTVDPGALDARSGEFKAMDQRSFASSLGTRIRGTRVGRRCRAVVPVGSGVRSSRCADAVLAAAAAGYGAGGSTSSRHGARAGAAGRAGV